MKSAVIRILVPALLIVTAIAWIQGGTIWMPTWMSNLGRRVDLTEVATARLAIGILFAVAVSISLLSARQRLGPFIARTSLVLFAFCSVATIASVMAASPTSAGLAPIIVPGLGLVISLLLYFGIDRMKDAHSADPSTASPPTATRGTIWVGAAFLAVWVLAIGTAARIPIADNAGTRQAGDSSILLDPVLWQGKVLPDTGLSRLVPMLTARTLEGRAVIVIYSPDCAHCRELFEKYFAVATPDLRVLAVSIPPAPGSVAVTGDNLGPVACQDCEHFSLPTGKTYLVKPPIVVVVENGRVTCATDNDFKTCLDAITSGSAAPVATPAGTSSTTP